MTCTFAPSTSYPSWLVASCVSDVIACCACLAPLGLSLSRGLQLFMNNGKGQDNQLYVAVVHCTIQKSYDCSLTFNSTSSPTQSPGFGPGDEVFKLLIPSSAVGLAFDANNSLLLLGFSGGSLANSKLLKSAGKMIEDRVMMVAVPNPLVSRKFNTTANELYLTFLGNKIISRCLVPFPNNVTCQRPSSSSRRALALVPHGQRHLEESPVFAVSKTLYKKVIPIFAFRTTTIVVVIPVEYGITADVTAQIDLTGKLDVEKQTLSVEIRPNIKLVVSAFAGVDLFIVRGGIKLIAIAVDTSFVPELRLILAPSGGVRACLDAHLEIMPLSVSLNAYYSTFTCITWIDVCVWSWCFSIPWIGWCPDNNFPIVEFRADTISIPLFQICFGPSDIVQPIAPANITLLQIGDNLTASWDVCNITSGKTTIERYGVWIGRTPGAGDVAQNTDLGSARVADFSGALASANVQHGTTLYIQVACSTLEGGSSQRTVVGLVVDKQPPSVLNAVIQRLPPNVSTPDRNGTASGARRLPQAAGTTGASGSESQAGSVQFTSQLPEYFTNATSALVSFEVHPSLCVAAVYYTLSSSPVAMDESAYYFDFAVAGDGARLNGTSATSSALATSSGGATTTQLGWTEPRVFSLQLSNQPFAHDSLVYLVVKAIGCR